MSDFIYRYHPGSRPDTLLLLHGTGGSESDLLDLGPVILPGANLLSPRGRILENGMPRFFRRLAEGVFDIEDIKYRSTELAAFIQAMAKEHGFDPDKVIPFGYSNGANIAAAMLLTGAAQFPRAVLIRPMVPLEPHTLPDLTGAQVLLARGLYDPMGTPAQTTRLRSLLEAGGATVTDHASPAGHQITQGDIRAATAWLARP
jgi:phospholipase/carboxylesterase/glyoxalase family protein